MSPVETKISQLTNVAVQYAALRSLVDKGLLPAIDPDYIVALQDIQKAQLDATGVVATLA